mgnify:CR=1 FL=1
MLRGDAAYPQRQVLEDGRAARQPAFDSHLLGRPIERQREVRIGVDGRGLAGDETELQGFVPDNHLHRRHGNGVNGAGEVVERRLQHLLRFLQKYYSGYNGIKFKNYPENATLIYSQKNGQNKTSFGIINVNNGIIKITQPIFGKVSYPDDNSLISKHLNITFAPLNKILGYDLKLGCFIKAEDFLSDKNQNVYCGKALLQKAFVSENTEIVDGKIYSVFENIVYPEQNDIPFYKFVKSKGNITFSGNLTNENIKLNTLKEMYDFFESNLNVEFVNYPDNIMFVSSDKLEVIDNEGKKVILYRGYDLNDKDSVFNNLTGLNASFQNSGFISVKKNDCWGVIDKNKNIIIPFEYNYIEPFNYNIREKITKLPGGKLKSEYLGKTGDNGIFLARKILFDSQTKKKSRIYYLLDSENNILASYIGNNPEDNDDIYMLKSRSTKKAQDDATAERRKYLPQDIMYFALDLLFLPIYLIQPFSFDIHEDINYFRR